MAKSSIDIRRTIVETITDIAPDSDLDALDDSADLADSLDLDSMDMLNIAAGILERTGVDIPDRDYAGLNSIDDLIGYLEPQL